MNRFEKQCHIKALKRSGLGKFKAGCRCTMYQGRMIKAWRVPDTREASIVNILQEKYNTLYKNHLKNDPVYVAYGKYGLNVSGALAPDVLRFDNYDDFLQWRKYIEYNLYKIISKHEIYEWTRFNSNLKIVPFSGDFLCWTKHSEFPYEFITTAWRDGSTGCKPERVSDML